MSEERTPQRIVIDTWTVTTLIYAQVDIAYLPFIERFQIFFSGIKNYDITKGKPNIQKFIEVILDDASCDYAISFSCL